MLVAMAFSTALVLVTVLIHYESLRGLSALLPRLPIPPRQRIIVSILGTFGAHTVEVWLYGAVYYFLAGHLGLGAFGGVFGGQFEDYLYFSLVTYTSLGFGDVYPLGGLRMIAGVETVAGLVMIAWSASFTYLAMEKFWGMHGKRVP